MDDCTGGITVNHPTCRARATAARALPWLLLGGLLAFEAQADVGNAVTVASGLSNPRGLAFAPNGDLYVAESGRGGSGNCTFSPPNPANQRCYGETGAITRILPEGGFERVVTGLPSLGLPDGTAEGGPVDVSFLGTAAIVSMSWGGNPTLRAALGPKGHLFGSLLQTTPGGTYRMLADVAQHEVRENPAGGNVDSNPYSVLAQPGRRIVADAGANALIEVRPNGTTRTFALIPFLPAVPPIPAPREPVPTSVVEGPDGALYVGELTGFPFWPGTASVMRVSSDGATVEPYVSGLTAVVDLAFDAGGALYVLEIARGQIGPFPPPPAPNPGLGIGRLLRKCPGAGAPEVLLPGLTFAAGVAIGPDGAAYLTNFSTSSTAGEVLRLPVTPCP
jgi:sugar lactone lactonase YvrE